MAAGSGAKVKQRRAVQYVCPVCTKKRGNSGGKGCAYHASAQQLRKCIEHDLIEQGYKKLGPGMFETPSGSILILGKPTRAKPGKDANRYNKASVTNI